MRQRRILFLTIALLAGLLLYWQLPAILKATPSRYVARLPEPVQALGERGNGAPILPTVVAPANAAELLGVTVTMTSTTRPVAAATATPLPAVTSTPEPTNTPEPVSYTHLRAHETS